MGHKVHPYSFRLGYIKNHRSVWFAKKAEYADLLHEDIKIRKFIKSNFSSANISYTEIERASNKIRVIVHAARPGIIIGRRGADIDRLRDELHEITKKEVVIDIKEIKNPLLEAQLVAENVSFQLVKRVMFRRVMKKAVQNAMNVGCQGIKVICSGRLGGAEMSRRESHKEGKIPLHTLRADIDYGFAEAHTTCGVIGIKVWIYKGDIFPKKRITADAVKTENNQPPLKK